MNLALILLKTEPAHPLFDAVLKMSVSWSKTYLFGYKIADLKIF